MLVNLVFLFVGFLSAATLNELFRSKYADIFDPPPPQLLSWYNDETGDIDQAELGLPLPIHAIATQDPVFLAKLANFEHDPQAVFSDRYFKPFLIHFPLEDYNTDPFSSQIIEKCLQYGPRKEFILEILSEAINRNRQEVFWYILQQYDIFDESNDSIFNPYRPLVSLMFRTGNFQMVKKLMISGKYLASPSHMACILFAHKYSHTAEIIDFLDFLIVQRQEINLNDLFNLPFRATPFKCTLLIHLLKSPNSSDFKSEIGQYLIGIGADVMATDEEGRTALEIAEIQGIKLF